MASSRLLFSKTPTRILSLHHCRNWNQNVTNWNLNQYSNIHFFSGHHFYNEIKSLISTFTKLPITKRDYSLPTLPEVLDRRKKEAINALQEVKQDHKQEVEQALTRINSDLKKYGRLNIEDIVSVVKTIKNNNIAITSTQGLYLLQCCGKYLPAELPKSRNTLAQEIWELLLSLKVPLDVSHFNTLLHVFLENEHAFNPLRFLASIVEKDIPPNRVTYQRLVAAYCQVGDLEGATRILDIMKHKNIAVDALTFNAIVMGHSVIGDWESAKEIIAVMTKNGLEPDSETYRNLLCGYAKHGVSSSIPTLIESCIKKDIAFSDEDLFAALYTAAIHDHSEIVDLLLKQMKKSLGYHQACVNIILRLVTQRKEDEAFKVLLSMKPLSIDGRVIPSGRFFIRHVVKLNCPSEKIISYCQKLVETGKNVRAFFTAIEIASSLEKTELMECLLREMKNEKNSFRSHFLGSLLTSESRIGGEKKVLDMLRKMATVRVFPNVETVKRHVLPHMDGDSEMLLQKLYSARLSFFVISVSLLQKSLDSHDFEDALRITSTFYIEMDKKLRDSATTAYLKTRNSSGLAKLIRSLLPESQEDLENDSKDLSSEIIGPILIEICKKTPKAEQLEAVMPLLVALRDQGLGISLSVAQILRETLDEGITPPVADLLAELSSGELIPIELDPRPKRLNWKNRAQVVKKQSEFCTLARERKLEEGLTSKKELEAQNIPFTDGMNLLLMDLYSYHGRLDEALAVFSELFQQKPDLIVFPSKLMSLATELVKAGRIDDAIRVLQQLKSDPRALETSDMMNSINACAMRLMNAAAEKGDVKIIRRIFDRLEDSKALKIKNSLLAPLVKVHVVRKDMEGALKEFDRCSKERRATPLNTELAAQLIEKDDTGNLERLMRMNSKVHGEMNSLYDLSLAFLRCDRVNQAKKVLETPGLRALNNRLNDVCSYYVRQQRIDELENFVKITRDLFNVDRYMLYDHLLSACIKADKPIRAVGVWTLMQEEGSLVPRDDFLRRLGDFLISKNMNVPFALPEMRKT